jgi:hypothetical protein
MPIRSAPDHPRYDPTVPPSPKNVFARDPVTIPQLFVEPSPPWYRRRSAIALIALALVCVVALAVLLYLNGVRGTVQLLGRSGVAGLRAFTRIAS